MIKNLIEKKEENEQGFTLIELMVVVLIIAILLAIAIPTFLGAKNTANARAAEANLRNALTAETSYFTNNNQVYGVSAGMSPLESALTWTDTAGGPANEPYANNTVYIADTAAQVTAANTGNQTDLLAVGQDGKCYWVQDVGGTVTYAKIAAASGSGSSTTCAQAIPSGANFFASTSAAGW
jgi:type IV pilus assembly protein PilA